MIQKNQHNKQEQVIYADTKKIFNQAKNKTYKSFTNNKTKAYHSKNIYAYLNRKKCDYTN